MRLLRRLWRRRTGPRDADCPEGLNPSAIEFYRIDAKVAATKDGSCGCDEILLERREEQQWFENGTWSVHGFWVAIACQDSAGLLVMDGCNCGCVLEGVSENGLFACRISGKRVADLWQKRSGCCTEESTARNVRSK